MWLLTTFTLFAVSCAGASELKDNKFNSAEINGLLEKGSKIYLSGASLSLRDLHNDDCKNMDENDIVFYLYTREIPYRHEMRTGDHAESMKNSSFSVSKETKVLIHSWLQRGESFGLDMARNYLYAQDVNVMVVDWSKYGNNCNFGSVNEVVVPVVGKILSRMIKMLISYGSKSEQFHLIGYGVGAHIAGIAGKMMKNQKLDRITALDPTKPGFVNVGTRKLSYGDAKFIDVIHTSAPELGVDEDMGTVDFYPNGGRTPQNSHLASKSEYAQILGSHRLSMDYFTESIIRRYAFEARKAHSWEKYTNGEVFGEASYMGEYVPRESKGRYYLEVNGQKPYGKSDKYTTNVTYFLHVYNTPNI